MKQHPWDKFIVRIEPKPEDQHEDVKLASQLVYDESDKSIRLDISSDDTHVHVPINRKQAIKMIKLLEEFVLFNP